MKALAIALVALVSLIGWAGPSEALDLKISEGLELKDSIGFAKNSDTGENPGARGMVVGIYTGSLAAFHTESGYKAIGLGGFAFYASSGIESETGITWVPTFAPISFWDDSIHIDVGKNLQDESYTIGLGVSGSLELLSKFGDAITGVVTK